MPIQLGSGLFLFCTIGLSLPSLASHHIRSPSQPLLSHSFISRHLLFSYTIASHRSLPLINSLDHTWMTYMFHHADINHFLGNAFSIVTSAIALDLGFIPSVILFYGGGVFGILSHMIETSLRSHEWDFSILNGFMSDFVRPAFHSFDSSEAFDTIVTRIESFRRNLPSPPRTFVLCGSSAGAYSMMGAEVYITARELTETWNLIRTYRSSQGSKHELYSKFSRLLVGMLGRAATLASQVYMTINQKQSLGFLRSSPDALIGHSAHVGGFIFGVLAMSILNKRNNVISQMSWLILVTSLIAFITGRYLINLLILTALPKATWTRKHHNLLVNHVVSYIHSISSSLLMLNLYIYILYFIDARFYTSPALLQTMLGPTLDPEAARQAQLIVAFSTGYFIHDCLDMVFSRVYLNSVGVWIHHFAVIACFSGAVAAEKYGVYLAFNLVVEINNVFIHQRKLMILTERPIDYVFNANSNAMFVSFVVCRFGGNGWILYKIIQDYSLFESEAKGVLCWAVALGGMLLLNYYNTVFYKDLKRSESKLRAKQVYSNKQL